MDTNSETATSLSTLDAPWSRVLGAIILTPTIYLAYATGVRVLRNRPSEFGPLLSVDGILLISLLALLGCLAAVMWTSGLRVAPVVGLGSLLLVPWLLYTGRHAAAEVALPVTSLMLIASVEWAIRSPSSAREVLREKLGRNELAVGISHLVIAAGLQWESRGIAWLDYSASGVVIGSVVYFVSACAIFGIGVLVVLAWHRHRLILPALANLSWVMWGIYGWMRGYSLPGSPRDLGAVHWVGIQPYPDYMLKWVVLLLGIAGVAVIELGLRAGVKKSGLGETAMFR